MTISKIVDRIAYWLDAPRDGRPVTDRVSGRDWFGRERRWRCHRCDVLWWGAGRDCWVCGRAGNCED